MAILATPFLSVPKESRRRQALFKAPYSFRDRHGRVDSRKAKLAWARRVIQTYSLFFSGAPPRKYRKTIRKKHRDLRHLPIRGPRLVAGRTEGSRPHIGGYMVQVRLPSNPSIDYIPTLSIASW